MKQVLNSKNIFSFFITLAVFQFSCAMSRGRPTQELPQQPKPQPPQSSAPAHTPTPQPINDFLKDATPLWETKVADGKEWTNFLYTEIDRVGSHLINTIPADANLFCPNYANLSSNQRKQYWIFLLSSMVRFESNFKTNTKYTESFNDSAGNPVISRGLLQISIESSKGYSCGMTDANELHNPYKNLSCGLRILDRWLSRDFRIAGKVSSKWQGGARYWSVLREGDKTSYKSIVSWSQNLSFCKR